MIKEQAERELEHLRMRVRIKELERHASAAKAVQLKAQASEIHALSTTAMFAKEVTAGYEAASVRIKGIKRNLDTLIQRGKPTQAERAV